MQQHTHTYLRFVRFKDLNQWDVKRFWDDLNVLFSSSVRLKDILSPHYEPVSKEEMLNKQWRIISKINFSGKLFLRDVSDAKTFKGNLNKIDSNTLIYSKINVRHGCIYFHPNNSLPFGVSSEYPAYKLNNQKVNGEFLVMIIQSDYFKNVLNQKTSGISKARVKPEEFLNINIPLPTLEQQQALVKAYNDKIQQAKTLEEQAERIDKNIENYLLTELGIKQNNYSSPESSISIASEPQVEYVISNHQNAEIPDAYHWGDEIKKEYKCLKFVRFKGVTEWGYDRLIGNNRTLLHSTIFPNKTLATLLEVNPRTSFSNLYDNDEISFIPMECISDEYGEWKEKRICKIASSKGYTKFMSGDLIWARITPCMQNGKSAIVDDLKNGYGCGSTEFHVLRNNNKQLNIHYVHSLLRMPIVLKDAMKSFTGSAGQQRVPKSYLENLTIPVPSLDVQNEIVEHINEQKEQIKQMKQQAETLRKEALEEFEKEIFE